MEIKRELQREEVIAIASALHEKIDWHFGWDATDCNGIDTSTYHRLFCELIEEAEAANIKLPAYLAEDAKKTMPLYKCVSRKTCVFTNKAVNLYQPKTK